MRTTNRSTRGKSPERAGVSRAVEDLLRRQVADRGLVVWYDPQNAYSELVERISIEECVVLKYESGFFRLREQLEPLLEYVNQDGTLKTDAEVAPRAIVYIPIARNETAYALIEAETAGVVVEPDAPSPERNSRLGRMVEEVFKKVAPAKAAHLARQADDGLLTVEDLDRLAGEAGSIATGALQIVFGQASAEEILLQFAAHPDKDADLEAKSALPELADLLRSETGLVVSDLTDCNSLRTECVHRFLIVDLLAGIPSTDIPQALSALEWPESPAHRDTIISICRQWRNRTDLKDAYAGVAEEAELVFGLRTMDWSVEALKTKETFPFIDGLLLDHAVERFLGEDPAEVIALANERSALFWARERPQPQLAWRVVKSAGKLAQTAAEIRNMIGKRKWSLDELVDAYALHAAPWMRLDRISRDMETRHARWEMAVTETEALEKLIAHARETYATCSGAIAETYAGALSQAAFSSARHGEHTRAFHDWVLPELDGDGRTAYFLVDALRFEMATELIEGLATEFDASVEPIIGCLPGITSVGMAALLPGSEGGLLIESGQGKLDVKIGNSSVTKRNQRLDWVCQQAGVAVCCAKLGEILKPSFRRRKDFNGAKLIVVTSQEIDQLGEEGDEEGIRLYIVDVLEKLRRAVRLLTKAGVSKFVMAADHGFLFAPGVDPGLTMDAPGGNTVEIHSRVWVGQGGSAGDGFIRVKASDMAIQGSLEFAFPLGLGSFRVKGGTSAYFHGGISPAENILPVVRLTPISAATAGGDDTVKLSMAKDLITNRLFSVTVEMVTKGLFPQEVLRLRFEVLSGQKKAGQAATAAYGFEDGTGEIAVKAGKPNVVTLMLNADAGQKVTIRVLDCRNQNVLDSLRDVPVKLGI
jgi:hypothetical protein